MTWCVDVVINFATYLFSESYDVAVDSAIGFLSRAVIMWHVDVIVDFAIYLFRE